MLAVVAVALALTPVIVSVGALVMVPLVIALAPILVLAVVFAIPALAMAAGRGLEPYTVAEQRIAPASEPAITA
ncbi:MAG: hypothetical protein ACREBE_10845 [bacterium]